MANEDSTKDTIMLPPLSEDEIARQQIPLIDLWMVRDEFEKMYGPYSTAQLKDYSTSHEPIFETSMVYNLGKDQWGKFFETPHFQRRLPQLIKAHSIILEGDFYILKEGQKTGPYTLEQLQILNNEGKLKLNSLISADDGDNWIKLYEHHMFDRRHRKGKKRELPYKPKEDIFSEIEKYTSTSKQRKEEEDALVGLAFVGQGNDRGQILNANTHTEFAQRPKNSIPKKSKTKFQFNPIQSFLSITEALVPTGNKRFYFAAVLVLIVTSVTFNTLQSNYKTSDNAPQFAKKADIPNTNIVNTDRKGMPKAKPLERKEIERAPSSTKRYHKPRAQMYGEDNPQMRKGYHAIDINDPEVRKSIDREIANDPDAYPGNDYPQDEMEDHDGQVQTEDGERYPEDENADYEEVNHSEVAPDEAQQIQDFE